MKTYYLPGMGRARFDALTPDEQKMYRAKPKKRIIPEDGEW